MPAETLNTSASGDEENIDASVSGPTNHWVDCKAQDILYVWQAFASVWRRDLFNCDNPGDIGPGDIINSVTIHIRVKKGVDQTGISYAQESIKSGGVAANAPSNALPLGYTEFSYPWAIPPEGGTWTLAKLNALQIGVNLYSYTSGKGSENANCDKVWAVVDYSPAASGGMAANMAAKMVGAGLI